MVARLAKTDKEKTSDCFPGFSLVLLGEGEFPSVIAETGKQQLCHREGKTFATIIQRSVGVEEYRGRGECFAAEKPSRKERICAVAVRLGVFKFENMNKVSLLSFVLENCFVRHRVQYSKMFLNRKIKSTTFITLIWIENPIRLV